MKQDQFDHTAIGPRINACVREVGDLLHDFCIGHGPHTRGDINLNIAKAASVLALEISNARNSIADIAGRTAGWCASVSLNSALSEAENCLANLANLATECAADSDGDFLGALSDLSVEMFTRDPAQEVYRLLTEGQG